MSSFPRSNDGKKSRTGEDDDVFVSSDELISSGGGSLARAVASSAASAAVSYHQQDPSSMQHPLMQWPTGTAMNPISVMPFQQQHHQQQLSSQPTSSYYNLPAHGYTASASGSSLSPNVQTTQHTSSSHQADHYPMMHFGMSQGNYFKIYRCNDRTSSMFGDNSFGIGPSPFAQLTQATSSYHHSLPQQQQSHIYSQAHLHQLQHQQQQQHQQSQQIQSSSSLSHHQQPQQPQQQQQNQLSPNSSGLDQGLFNSYELFSTNSYNQLPTLEMSPQLLLGRRRSSLFGLSSLSTSGDMNEFNSRAVQQQQNSTTGPLASSSNTVETTAAAAAATMLMSSNSASMIINELVNNWSPNLTNNVNYAQFYSEQQQNLERYPLHRQQNSQHSHQQQNQNHIQSLIQLRNLDLSPIKPMSCLSNCSYSLTDSTNAVCPAPSLDCHLSKLDENDENLQNQTEEQNSTQIRVEKQQYSSTANYPEKSPTKRGKNQPHHILSPIGEKTKKEVLPTVEQSSEKENVVAKKSTSTSGDGGRSIKKRTLTEARPTRMTYSDVLSKLNNQTSGTLTTTSTITTTSAYLSVATASSTNLTTSVINTMAIATSTTPATSSNKIPVQNLCITSSSVKNPISSVNISLGQRSNRNESSTSSLGNNGSSNFVSSGASSISTENTNKNNSAHSNNTSNRRFADDYVIYTRSTKKSPLHERRGSGHNNNINNSNNNSNISNNQSSNNINSKMTNNLAMTTATATTATITTTTTTTCTIAAPTGNSGTNVRSILRTTSPNNKNSANNGNNRTQKSKEVSTNSINGNSGNRKSLNKRSNNNNTAGNGPCEVSTTTSGKQHRYIGKNHPEVSPVAITSATTNTITTITTTTITITTTTSTSTASLSTATSSTLSTTNTSSSRSITAKSHGRNGSGGGGGNTNSNTVITSTIFTNVQQQPTSTMVTATSTSPRRGSNSNKSGSQSNSSNILSRKTNAHRSGSNNKNNNNSGGNNLTASGQQHQKKSHQNTTGSVTGSNLTATTTSLPAVNAGNHNTNTLLSGTTTAVTVTPTLTSTTTTTTTSSKRGGRNNTNHHNTNNNNAMAGNGFGGGYRRYFMVDLGYQHHYEFLKRFLYVWYTYTKRILLWLFYLVYDIVYFGCTILFERLQQLFEVGCICAKQWYQDMRRGNAHRPGQWFKSLWRYFDGMFSKNSRWAFWRRFCKRRFPDKVYEPIKNGRLPQTGEEAMYSLLNCKGKDAYSILGVPSNCPQEQIRKHYKKIAVLVHPDKNKQPGAEEAFKVLQRAFELIGEPENRQHYDSTLVENIYAEKAWTELHDLLSQLHIKITEAANTIRCSTCASRHPRKLTDRRHYAARECASCKIRHSAREGDIWAETRFFGFCWKYLALMDGKVYDITEWANCQKGALAHLEPNSHIVQYRIVRGQQNSQLNQQQRQTQPVRNPVSSSNSSGPQANQYSQASLHEFLDNLYSGQHPRQQSSGSGAASFSGANRRRNRRN